MGHKIIQSKTIESRTDFFYYMFRNILLISIPFITISALILSLPHSSADSSNNGSGSSTDSLTFSISSSCALSSVVDSSHNAELNNGTYVDNIGKTTITTLCNDGNGYSIYAVGYSGNVEGNSKLVNSVNSNFNIDTGLATSGLTSNWSMSLNNVVNDISPTPPEIEDNYDGVYGLVPTEWTKVASLPSRSTDMVKGSSFTTTYAVYTSSFQNAGTYNGQVKYMLVHPSYLPAVYFMQDVATWKNMLAMGESVQAIDERDGKTYWVTKLEDGNIWMTQNLDLDIGGTGVAALTSENTDISTTTSGSGIYSDGYSENNGVWTWSPTTTAITSNTIINNSSNSVPGWSDTANTIPYSAEGGNVYYYTSNSSTDDIKYTSLSSCTADNHTETECNHYHAGNYYNWTAAIASNNSVDISAQYADASNSICPKGWRLPIATNYDQSIYEFGNLLYTYNITQTRTENPTQYSINGFDAIRRSPLWFIRAGNLYSKILGHSTTMGFYWSATNSDYNTSYMLRFDKEDIRPSHIAGKFVGVSIRCLAR